MCTPRPRASSPFVLNGRTYHLHAGGGGRALLFGDSHLEQYGARIHPGSRPSTRRTESSPTWSPRPAVPPSPASRRTSTPGASARRADALELARRADIDTIVAGACWNADRIEMTAPPSGERRGGTPESFEYYLEGPGPARGGQASLPRRDATSWSCCPGRDAGDAGSSRRSGCSCCSTTRSGPIPIPRATWPAAASHDASLSRGGAPSSTDVARAGGAPCKLHPGRRPRRSGRPSIPWPSLCAGDLCPIRDGRGAFIYRDRNHLRVSTAGAELGYLDVALGRPLGPPPSPLSAHR